MALTWKEVASASSSAGSNVLESFSSFISSNVTIGTSYTDVANVILLPGKYIIHATLSCLRSSTTSQHWYARLITQSGEVIASTRAYTASLTNISTNMALHGIIALDTEERVILQCKSSSSSNSVCLAQIETGANKASGLTALKLDGIAGGGGGDWSVMSVAEGLGGVSTTERVMRADYLRDILIDFGYECVHPHKQLLAYKDSVLGGLGLPFNQQVLGEGHLVDRADNIMVHGTKVSASPVQSNCRYFACGNGYSTDGKSNDSEPCEQARQFLLRNTAFNISGRLIFDNPGNYIIPRSFRRTRFWTSLFLKVMWTEDSSGLMGCYNQNIVIDGRTSTAVRSNPFGFIGTVGNLNTMIDIEFSGEGFELSYENIDREPIKILVWVDMLEYSV